MIPFLSAGRILWRYRKAIGIAVAALAAAWFAGAKVTAYGDARETGGRAAVQVRWDAANVVASTIAAKAETDRIAKEAADAARNQEIDRAYRQKLAAADADRARLERLLRAAIEAGADSGGHAEAAGVGSPAPASAQGSHGPPDAAAGELAAAVAAALTEARANSDQLDALIGEIEPQVERAGSGL